MLSTAADKNKSPTTSQTQSSEPSRNHATATSAAIAAALDATRAHQALFPGLATLFFDGSSSNNTSKYTSLIDPIDDALNFLPSVEAVSNAALKSIDDFPPYVTMNIRDSAPQLTLEDVTPNTINDNEKEAAAGSVDFSRTIRRFVVRGGMRGYRMSRASHGVSHGCYYYEAIVLGSKSGVGMKRPREEGEKNANENEESIEVSDQNSGHLRIGWSTMLGDLQAPVGYDKYSYGVRDIMGSRIHNKRREDKWGGQGFGPGDVIGFLICLNKKTIDGADHATSQTNYIQVFKNGVSMGDEQKSAEKAFENVTSDTYFPAVSCYLNGTVHMNFGPHFVYSPAKLPNGETPKPVCDLCASPPSPEEAEEIIVSSSKEGRKIFLSKRTDEGIVTAFKELVRTEATIRRDAHARHLMLQKINILALRNERGLPTLDLFGND